MKHTNTMKYIHVHYNEERITSIVKSIEINCNKDINIVRLPWIL